MEKENLVSIMNQLIDLSKDARKLANDFGHLATQVAVIIGTLQNGEDDDRQNRLPDESRKR